MTAIPFGDWHPDLPAKNNPGALVAKNCLPYGGASYGPLREIAPNADPLALQCRGSYWAIYNGVKYNFAADVESLYLFDNAGSWDDVSKVATVYSASFWDFVSFQNRVIATDGGAGALQYFDMGTSSEFDDLPGSPPVCGCLGVVRDFVVLGDYEIGSEQEPGGLAWSGFNNTEIWTPALATQCGRRRTRGAGGNVVRIVSGSQGLVFRQSSILLMRYAGPPTIWQFDDVTTLHGTPAGRSVCWTKDLAFYYSQEGFMQINRTSLEITPIGHDKVNRWFLDNCAPAEIVNLFGAVDRANSLVWWAFRSTSSSAPFNRLLVYNWVNKRWSYAEIEVEWMGEFLSAGFNLDTIGAFLGGNIDNASINVDSQLYSGGALSFIGFDADHVSGPFDGAPLVAEIDTKELLVSDRKRAFVNGVHPEVEGGSDSIVTIAPVTRNLPTANPVQGSFVGVNTATGQCDMRVNARYQRYRVRVAGGFDHAVGVRIEPKTRGRR